MPLLCIARRQFLDRLFSPPELAAAAEMFRQWYLIAAGSAAAQASIEFAVHVYGFARPEAGAICHALSSRLPHIAIERPDAEEIRIKAPPLSADQTADSSLWTGVLAEPLLQDACVLLRWTLQGPIPKASSALRTRTGQTSFVLCGAPAEGSLRLKALWTLGADESIQALYRFAPWPAERPLLEAISSYLEQRRSAPAEGAARQAAAVFGRKNFNMLFQAEQTEAKAMLIMRQVVELPDERGPLPFLRRLALPAVAAVALIAWGLHEPRMRPLTTLLSAAALALALGVAWQKMRSILRYYTAMRQGLGKLHSGTVDYKLTDLSGDRTPTLLKYSRELEARGAQLICDHAMATAAGTFDGNRVYRLADTLVSIGLLRKHGNLEHYPPLPILVLETRFRDGRRHFTINRPNYRKTVQPGVTGRCAVDGEGTDEILALHRRHVEQLIAAGAVPVSPPASPAALLEHRRQESKEAREAWNRAPYSWSDALHESFKICRREYLDRA